MVRLLLKSAAREEQMLGAQFLRSLAGIRSGPVALLTSSVLYYMVSRETWRAPSGVECVGDLAQLFKLVFSGLGGSIRASLFAADGTLSMVSGTFYFFSKYD